MPRVLLLGLVSTSIVACSSTDVRCPGATVEDPDLGACVCPPGSTPIEGGRDCAFDDAGVDPDAGFDAGLDAAPPPIDAGPAPAAPRAWYPWNGFRTGSVYGADNGTLRPTFEWDAAAGATDYQIQLDDSCTSPGFADCTFDSPELDERTATTVFRPDADLPVSMTAPVGRRYYWRVRGCRGEQCGEWSAVMYLNVGRERCDLNGDGHAELVVGGDEADFWMYVADGDGRVTSPSWNYMRLEAGSDRFPLGAACGSDLNGDGRDELVVVSCEYAEGGTGYHPCFVSVSSLVSGTMNEVARFAEPSLYEGGLFGITPTSMAASGDLDGDGFDDLAIGDSFEPLPGLDDRSGTVSVFRGSTAGIVAEPWRVTRQTTPAQGERFGAQVQIDRDFDGDGFVDLLGGVPRVSDATPRPERIVWFSGREGLTTARDIEYLGVSWGRYAVGDFDGDHRADLVVSDRDRLHFRWSDGAETNVPAVGMLLWSNDVDHDAIDDLMLAGSGPLAATIDPSIVFGSSDRSVSSLSLPRPTDCIGPSISSTRGFVYLGCFGARTDLVTEFVLEDRFVGGARVLSGVNRASDFAR